VVTAGIKTALRCNVCSVGWVAQSVEQRTENPCVGGSIPPPATTLFTLYFIEYAGFTFVDAGFFQSKILRLPENVLPFSGT
jgi:hypothetical protein